MIIRNWILISITALVVSTLSLAQPAGGEARPGAADRPADALKYATTLIDHKFQGEAADSDWSLTKGTTLTKGADHLTLKSSHWDCKIYRWVSLPKGNYRVSGEGGGNVRVTVERGDFKGPAIGEMNLTAKVGQWKTDSRTFQVPGGDYAFVVQVTGPADEARIKWVKLEAATGSKPAETKRAAEPEKRVTSVIEHKFQGEAADSSWSFTKGTTLTKGADYLTLKSTHWDCKAYRWVSLPQGTYRISGEGGGKVRVAVERGDFKQPAISEINLSAKDGLWTTDARGFETPGGDYALVVQVSGPADEARIKWVKLEAVTAPKRAAMRRPTNAAKLATSVIDHAFEGEAGDSGWSFTKGTSLTKGEDCLTFKSSHWDCKIYRWVTLPKGNYCVFGEGGGNVQVTVQPGDFKQRPLGGMNLSAKDGQWKTDYCDFASPGGEYALVVQVNGPADEARMKWLKLESAPVPETAGENTPTPEELAKHRPNPAMVRGFMVGQDIKEADYAELEKWGVNVVRVQFTPVGFAQARKKSLWEAWPDQLQHLEEHVKLAKAHNMKVVLDLHEAVSESRRQDHDQWDDPALESNMIRVWREIAQRMQPYKESIWAYELWNEPLDRAQLPWAPRQWRPLAIKMLKAIREVDPETWVVYGPGPGSMWRGIETLKPLPDTHIIYTVHWYSPGSFTHQGVYLKHGTDMTEAATTLNFRYPGENSSSYTSGGGKVYWDRAMMEAELASVDEFAKKWNVPMFIGEFSVIRWAPSPDGANWLRDSIGMFEQRGWSWTYHAFREYQGWSLEHPSGPKSFWMQGMPYETLNKKAEKETDRAAVVKEFLKRNGKGN